MSLKTADEHTDCRQVVDYTLEYGRLFTNGTISWTSVALPADATAYRVVNVDPGDYVVRLTVSNAGGQSSFLERALFSVKSGSEDGSSVKSGSEDGSSVKSGSENDSSVKSGSENDSSVNTGLVAGLVICILVILAMAIVVGSLFRWHRCEVFLNSQARYDFFTIDPYLTFLPLLSVVAEKD